MRLAALVSLAGTLMLSPSISLAQVQPDPVQPDPVQPDPVQPERDQPDAVFEMRRISGIVFMLQPDDPKGGLEIVPLDPKLARLALNQMRSSVGQPYSSETFAEDIRRLTRRPEFGRLISNVRPQEDGSVTLSIFVTIQPIILDIQVVGNRLISDQDIAKVTSALIDLPIDKFRIDRFARRVEDLYREKGYYLSHVEAELDDVAETGTLIFVIREGERLKVTDIRFEGVGEELDFSDRELKEEIRTRTASWFKTGPLDQQALFDDRASLRQFYLNRGYLDVRVDFQTTHSLNDREAIVTYKISEGRRYTMRNVRVFYPEYVHPQGFPSRAAAQAAATPGQGIHVLPDIDGDGKMQYVIYDYGVFSPEQISGFIDIKSGDLYSQAKLRKVDEEIASRYGQMGFTYPANPDAIAPVSHLEMHDDQEPLVDLFITIIEKNPAFEKKRFRVGEVFISGNEHTDQAVVRERVQLLPNRPLDTTARDETVKRLLERRLFNPSGVRVTYQKPDPLRPSFRDLLVEVKETNTGAFSIGGIVTSDSGLIGRINVTQRNFDIFDTPDSWGELFAGRAFRGGGQTVSLDVLPGTEVATYALSFSDPTFIGTRNSFGISGFYRRTDFRENDEDRYGGRVNFGRRFGSRWNGGIGFRAEWVQLNDIDDDLPVDIFDVEDLNMIASVSLNLQRTSVDSLFIATRGNRIAMRIEQVGQDFSFTKLEAEYAVFIPIYEDFVGHATVFSFQTNARYIPQGTDEVPVYERYYLGGQSFRGFDFRTISPKGIARDGTQTDDPVGGTWSFFAGIELRQPVYRDIVSVVVFLDTGTVVDEIGFDDYRVSTGFGFRLGVPLLSPVPLAFDFGFPIVSQSGDDSRLFTFTVDVPFR
ncbi:MAG: BamA/TamA family outer membrane protein [Acidobacteria bacterium]|nr:BamA/TamA family outer membrane protein [Acidobacteriota bacterium]